MRWKQDVMYQAGDNWAGLLVSTLKAVRAQVKKGGRDTTAGL
jgi:hypothetical protein